MKTFLLLATLLLTVFVDTTPAQLKIDKNILFDGFKANMTKEEVIVAAKKDKKDVYKIDGNDLFMKTDDAYYFVRTSLEGVQYINCTYKLSDNMVKIMNNAVKWALKMNCKDFNESKNIATASKDAGNGKRIHYQYNSEKLNKGELFLEATVK